MSAERVAALAKDVHPLAVEAIGNAGFEVRRFERSAGDDELLAVLDGAEMLGLRSKPVISERVIEGAGSLLVIGCFSSGTEHLRGAKAAELGIPVLNSHENAESVTQLTMLFADMLVRRITVHHEALQAGIWTKTDEDSHELAGLTMGVVGLGAVGELVAKRAKERDMNVLYLDPYKSQEEVGDLAVKVDQLEDLLGASNVLTLHCPSTGDGQPMMGEEQFAQMPDDSYFINTARADLVDLVALRDARLSGKLAGAAVDVHYDEPSKYGASVETILQGLTNVITTPHVGAATKEAQDEIGRAAAKRSTDFIDTGNITVSDNFPHVWAEREFGTDRITYVHWNRFGALDALTTILSREGINIGPENSSIRGEIGYAVFDVETTVTDELRKEIEAQDHAIRVRVIKWQLPHVMRASTPPHEVVKSRNP